jgi:hypothetical protein
LLFQTWAAGRRFQPANFVRSLPDSSSIQAAISSEYNPLSRALARADHLFLIRAGREGPRAAAMVIEKDVAAFGSFDLAGLFVGAFLFSDEQVTERYGKIFCKIL